MNAENYHHVMHECPTWSQNSIIRSRGQPSHIDRLVAAIVERICYRNNIKLRPQLAANRAQLTAAIYCSSSVSNATPAPSPLMDSNGPRLCLTLIP
ncbi:unnamed protein product, partial [Iphiclides podalirius]